MATTSDHFDLTGMRCPMPIVQLNQIVQELPPGREFTVVADDPAFELDLRAWCEKTGHQLIQVRSEGDQIVVVLVRS